MRIQKDLATLVLTVFCSTALLWPLPCKGQRGFQANLGLQYSYAEYGRQHGFQAPFSMSYQHKNVYFGLSAGWGVGLTNWNYDGDPNKIYNLDINRTVPPWAFFQFSSFLDPPQPITLTGTTGYGVRIFGAAHIGYRFKAGGRPLSVEGGIYLTRVTTSFIAAKAEDVMVYNNFGPNDPEWIFPTELLFPVSVIYLDIGPFVGVRYQISKEGSRLPFGVATSWYHGFYDNGWFNLGLYVDMPISRSLQTAAK